jgi:hypothetical protein
MVARLSLSLVMALAGCGPAKSAAAGPALPLTPMSLVFAGPREEGEPIGQLLGDGSIVTKHEGIVARLLPNGVIGRDGKRKLEVDANGDVWLDRKLPPMHFDARGALVSPTGESIYVDDRGTPSWSGMRGELPALVGVHFVPFTPEARRTAEVVFAIILEAVWSRGMT